MTRHVSRQLVLALITLLGVAVAHGQGAYPTSESPGQVQFQSAANPANGYGNEVRQPLADSAKTDTRVVCKRVKPTGSSVRRQQCATNAQWRAAREAEIVSLAGQPGAVTIATNMAGRGTDIKLGGDVRIAKPSVVKDPDGKDVDVEECGGLHIIGSERHESRRIDRQLRGRSGRQGDPGASQFFLSLEDDLMRLFGSERIARLMDRMGAQDGDVLTHPLITRSIEQAQKRVELQNFQSRKRLLEYDDVMNQQREVIYSLRSFALDGGEELKGESIKMVEQAVARRILETIGGEEDPMAWDVDVLRQDLMLRYLLTVPCFEEDGIRPKSTADAEAEGRAAGTKAFHAKIEALGDFADQVLALVMLNVLDEKWKDHLYDLDQLRNAIHYRSWGQKDPLIEYKQEAYTMFVDLMHDVHHTFAERFLRVQVQFDAPAPGEAEGRAFIRPNERAALPPAGTASHATVDEFGVMADPLTGEPESAVGPTRPEPAFATASASTSSLRSRSPARRSSSSRGRHSDHSPEGRAARACRGALTIGRAHV